MLALVNGLVELWVQEAEHLATVLGSVAQQNDDEAEVDEGEHRNHPPETLERMEPVKGIGLQI